MTVRRLRDVPALLGGWGVGGRGAAQEARLRGDVAEVFLVADAHGLAEGQGALVDPAAKVPRTLFLVGVPETAARDAT